MFVPIVVVNLLVGTRGRRQMAGHHQPARTQPMVVHSLVETMPNSLVPAL